MSQIIVTSPHELQAIVARAVSDALRGISPQAATRRYVTEEEAARIIGTTPSSLRSRRCRKKGPPYIKDGARVMYDVSEIEKYMDSLRVKTRGARDAHAQ